MLEISKSIRDLDDSDISDNLFYSDYNTKHLLSLIKKGMEEDDPLYMSSYRSFEGEVFENFVYEKLLRYAAKNDNIEKINGRGIFLMERLSDEICYLEDGRIVQLKFKL